MMRVRRQKRERLSFVWLMAFQFGMTVLAMIAFYDFLVGGGNADIFSTMSGPAAREAWRDMIRNDPWPYLARILLTGGIAAICAAVAGTIWALRKPAMRAESRRREETSQVPRSAAAKGPQEDSPPRSLIDTPPEAPTASECSRDCGKGTIPRWLWGLDAAMIGLFWLLLGGLRCFGRNAGEQQLIIGCLIVSGGALLAFAVGWGLWAGVRRLPHQRR